MLVVSLHSAVTAKRLSLMLRWLQAVQHHIYVTGVLNWMIPCLITDRLISF